MKKETKKLFYDNQRYTKQQHKEYYKYYYKANKEKLLKEKRDKYFIKIWQQNCDLYLWLHPRYS
jgi:hypothetical protein